MNRLIWNYASIHGRDVKKFVRDYSLFSLIQEIRMGLGHFSSKLFLKSIKKSIRMKKGIWIRKTSCIHEMFMRKPKYILKMGIGLIC